MEIATIGFTHTTAERFFGRIRDSGHKTVADVRLSNTSQLAGFAKRDDLAYFLRAVCGAEYLEIPELAPEDHTLKAYRNRTISWEVYSCEYRALLGRREVHRSLSPALFGSGVVFLCSEEGPERCHRRLAAEYLQSYWADVTIRHL